MRADILRVRWSRQSNVMWPNPVRCEMCSEWKFEDEPHECIKESK